ncbi:MAG: hypothetical protein IJH88_01090 [Eggerthellaceae bacterium]|nr:hypothetical protein [Eggerthellaceae bacterium]
MLQPNDETQKKGPGIMGMRRDDGRKTGMLETADYETRSLGFREALELARSAWDDEVYGGEIDYCCETDDAFLFRRRDYMSFDGPGPILVWKSGGGFGNYVAYNLEGGFEIVRDGYLAEFGE